MPQCLLIFEFSGPCGSVTGYPVRLTLLGMPKNTTGLAIGIPAIARIKDSDGKIWVSGLTVGALGSGANIEINSMSVAVNQVVNLLSGVVVHG